MAFTASDWTITRQTGNIRYIGDDHGGASPSYATIIEFHRALMDLADDPNSSGDDQIAIYDQSPTDRSTDNIVTLLDNYNIDDTAAEHLYDGSVIQSSGAVIYDGIVNYGNTSNIQIIQNGAVLSDDWWNSNGGLNADSTNGISHRFLLKVRTGGADIDGRRLIGTSRTFGSTYSEFKISGTARGNNVLALSEATDLNNATAAGTVATWTTITNTEGYRAIDVDGDGSDENYYSEWNKDSFTINQLYERMKWLTRDGSASTIYGLNGELFRGITHEITVDTPTGTFSAVEAVSWTGGTGQMLAINSTTAATKMWIQLLTGVAPTDGQTITGGTSSATVDVNVTVTERTISAPFIGTSTGSALIGAYGVGIEAADLSSSDSVVDLTNTTVNPPNNVTFTVSGLVSGDRVLVTQRGYRFDYDTEAGGPFTVGETLTGVTPAGTYKLVQLIDNGTTGTMVISEPITGSVPTDNTTLTGGTSAATAAVDETNNAVSSDINYGQLSLNATLTGASVTSVVCTAAIPTDTPSTGTIRLERDDGTYTRIAYTSYTSATFTIGATDFSTNNATAGNNLFVSYIDTATASTSENFTGVYSADRNLFIRVRDGGASPIKPFETTGTLTDAGGSTTAIRTSDA